jgi:hypothetical protein
MRFTVQGTHTAELWGIAPTGNRIVWDAIMIYRLADGRIAEQWAAEDWTAQLDVSESSGMAVESSRAAATSDHHRWVEAAAVTVFSSSQAAARSSTGRRRRLARWIAGGL